MILLLASFYLYEPKTFAQYLYSPPTALWYDLEAHGNVCDGKSNLFFIYSERLSSAYSIMAHSYFTPHHKRWKECGDEWDVWEYVQEESSGSGAAESAPNKNNADSVEWVILSAVTAYFLLPLMKYDIRQHSLNNKLNALSCDSQFVLLQATNKCTWLRIQLTWCLVTTKLLDVTFLNTRNAEDEGIFTAGRYKSVYMYVLWCIMY